jgi:hypothetical protein
MEYGHMRRLSCLNRDLGDLCDIQEIFGCFDLVLDCNFSRFWNPMKEDNFKYGELTAQIIACADYSL